MRDGRGTRQRLAHPIPESGGGSIVFNEHVAPEYEYVGDMVRAHSYDALGRLIRTVGPFTDGSNPDKALIEHFYYDGVRRIQEVRRDPMGMLVAPGGGIER